MLKSIWIIKDSGQNLFYKDFTNATSHMDENLLSGFFVAINNFAQESGSGVIDSLILKDAKFVYLNAGPIFVVVSCDRTAEFDYLRKIMLSIGNLFLEKYGTLDNWDGNISQFEGFSEILDKELKIEIPKKINQTRREGMQGDDEGQNKIFYKTIIIGDPGVGKTSLLIKHSEGKFQEEYIPTLGVDVKKLSYAQDSNINFKNTVWDVSGQRSFRQTRKNYYPNTDCFLILYDVSNLGSFEDIEDWIDEIKPYTRKDGLFFIVGNKIDLNGKTMISSDEGKRKASELGFEFYETSAKTGKNVEDLFDYIGKKIIEKKINKK